MANETTGRIVLKDVRLSFPSLFKRASFDGQEGKFEATFLIDKNDPQLKKIEAAMNAKLNDYFKGKVPKGLKSCLNDGDEKDYDGYAGMMSLKAASNKRVTIIDRDKTPLAEEDNKPYAGCYVNASIDFWVQDNNYGKRINCNLVGVQFSKDGEPFGAGAIDATDDFDEIDDDDDDDI